MGTTTFAADPADLAQQFEEKAEIAEATANSFLTSANDKIAYNSRAVTWRAAAHVLRSTKFAALATV